MSSISYQTVRLTRGRHQGPDQGACVMELASMLAGEPFSDHPTSTCPVIGAFLRAYNDGLPEDRRQDLYEYAAKVVGTSAGRRVRRMRARLCLEWLAEQTPGCPAAIPLVAHDGRLVAWGGGKNGGARGAHQRGLAPERARPRGPDDRARAVRPHRSGWTRGRTASLRSSPRADRLTRAVGSARDDGCARSRRDGGLGGLIVTSLRRRLARTLLTATGSAWAWRRSWR